MSGAGPLGTAQNQLQHGTLVPSVNQTPVPAGTQGKTTCKAELEVKRSSSTLPYVFLLP